MKKFFVLGSVLALPLLLGSSASAFHCGPACQNHPAMTASPDSITPSTGGYTIATVRANRSVVKAGMDVTLYARFSQVGPGQTQIVDLTTGQTWNVTNNTGIVTRENSPTTQVYAAQVDDSGTITHRGQSVSVLWQSGANATSNQWGNSSGQSANARYSLSAGANATSLAITEYIGNYGMGNTGFQAESFDETVSGSILQNWTALGPSTSASFSQTFSNGSQSAPVKVQMTGYAVPIVNGSYDWAEQAKAPAATFVFNAPSSPYGPELVSLGSNITLTGYSSGSQVWFTPIGLSNKTRWQTAYANSSGDVNIPANRMGAIEYIGPNGTDYYVDVQE
jgi:hypothetical protein